MYLSVRRAPADVDAPDADPGASPADKSPGKPRVRGPIYALGLTSFFTDISSEMVAVVLPTYLIARLGIGEAAFGAIEGLLAASGVLLLLLGGILADRTRRPKPVAVGGYSLSALTRLGLLTSFNPIGFLMADRLGKGFRAAPRDALISFHSDPKHLGRSFSVHRSLDTAGAMIGPLIVFAIFTILPDDYQTVFAISLLAGLLGVAMISIGVPGGKVDRRQSADGAPATSYSPLRLRDLPNAGGVKRVSLTAAVLGTTTVSDAMLYLVIFRTGDLELKFFPLLFVGTSLAYLALAIPMGILSDRIGKPKVLLAAQPIMLAIYLILLITGGPTTPVIVGCLALLGAYYAMTDGLFPAVASELTPIAARGRGIAAVGFGTAAGRLLAGLAFGAVWEFVGIEVALSLFAIALVVATGAAAVILTPLMSNQMSTPASGASS